MKKILFFFVLLLPFTIFGQQNPPNIEWKQINTQNFRIIFPAEISDLASQTAYLMDSVYKLDTRNLMLSKPKKVDLLLYNRSVVSNAYAALGPRKMVWYLTPPSSPSITLSPWNMILGIHEFRHTTQFAMMNGGFTKLAHLLFGQYGWAALSNWAYPNWFFEGDAVYHETIFSNSGRGRLPSFSLPLRAIYHSKQKISYEKALFRSYKTYYPNHYYLGYHIVSYINRHYSEDVWNKIIARTNMFSYWPYSFERSVKKYTGSNIRKTYKKTFKEFDSLWTKELWDNLDTTVAKKVVTTPKRIWTNYFDPQIIGKDSILMLKSGLDDNTQLVLWSNGQEQLIREISGENISYSHNTVIWTDYTTNPRFEDETFLDIVKYDLKTKKLTKITHKGKYFSPELSHDGKSIVAVKIGTDLIPQIVILDLDGNELLTYKGKLNQHLMKPVWTADDKSIAFLKLGTQGESMILLNLKTKEQKTLIPAQWIKFDNPYAYKNYIIFNYDYSGITNIYAIDLRTKQIYLVSSRPYGSTMAVVDSFANRLVYTDYQLMGLDIVESPFEPKTWKPIEKVEKKNFNYFLSDTTAETLNPLNYNFAKIHPDYKIEKYRPWLHYFNPHSWTPISNGDDIGFQIFSDDKLNTISMMYQLDYVPYADAVNHYYTVSYKKYFPVFSYNIYGGKYSYVLDKQTDPKNAGNTWGYDSVATWNKVGTSLSLSVPLNLSRDIYIRTFNASISTGYEHLYNFSSLAQSDLNFNYTQMLLFSGFSTFTNRRIRSYRDLYSRWGEELEIGGSYIPQIFELKGYKYYAKANFYLPGLMKHHGIKLSIAAEKNNPVGSGYMYMSNSVAFPRGMTPVAANQIISGGIDYTLPLLYPDFNIPYVLFVKRIRATLFADFAVAGLNGVKNRYMSTGIDLNFDFNIFRANYFMFRAGVRFAYSPLTGEYRFIPLFLDIPLN